MKALLRVFGLARFDPAAEALYRAAVKEGRRELYYADWPEKALVPDTVDGRFDLISLMAALLNRRIGMVARPQQNVAQNLAQELFDVMFADVDTNLRELGVSDEGMKHKIKPMASAHLGRVKAYTDCLFEADENNRLNCLAAAFDRNIYRTVAGADPLPLARRAMDLATQLAAASDDDILAGRFEFADPQTPSLQTPED
ncbi:MAG: ubiquinol-cytochrome C chaperone [Rhodospirillales bacterium]|nr:ubiquinol-cytochrome C chaperone [Rhodospirillales bacterium]